MRTHILRQLLEASAVGSIALVGVLAGDWIASLALFLLFAGWRILIPAKDAPVIAAAFSAQWLQVTAGLIYFSLSGRAIYQMRTADYRPMMLIGLTAVVVLFTGFFVGARFRRRRIAVRSTGPALPFTTYQIAVAYAVTVAIAGMLLRFAWSAGGLTQSVLVLTRVRYLLLFILISRLAGPKPNLPAIGAVLLLELALGFTGFFAEFREPLVISAIAVLGAMDRRKLSTWAVLGFIVLLAIGSALLWTAIKPIVRKNYVSSASTIDRLNTAAAVAANTLAPDESKLTDHADTLVSRVWAVYFPALALKRVPEVVPYENGAILRSAVENVLTPRLFNPDKPAIASPSDEVRKYAGVWVRGREFNTSIAFGYVGEAYVDFGIPWMFVPILVYGLIAGVAYRWLSSRIRYDELRTGAKIVIFWTILGSYETSWVMMIGPAIMILAVLGGGAIIVDRIVSASETGRVRVPSQLV